MTMCNPRHPVIIAAGLSLKPKPAHPHTVIRMASRMRILARWASRNGLTSLLQTWTANDLQRFVHALAEGDPDDEAAEDAIGALTEATVRSHLATLQWLHQYRAVLTCGGFAFDACRGNSARQAARATSATPNGSTSVIVPEVWFPMIRAAWTYVHVFAPDVLRTMARYAALREAAVKSAVGVGQRLDAFLADQNNTIPVLVGLDGQMRPNWRCLTLKIGIDTVIFDANLARCRPNRERVEAVIAAGHPTTTGLFDDLTEVDRPDGTRGPWHPGLTPHELWRERIRLRNACFVLVAGLSMMRDSEIHEITKGSVIEHYGYPAVTSIKRKRDPSQPAMAWWITEPVAEAIAVAEQISVHQDRVFAPSQRLTPSQTVFGPQMVNSFIARVNATVGHTGLDPIPERRVLPHMFRRTMALLTDQFAGSEIALGIQLKHVATRALANRTTQGYTAADTSWAEHLDTAIEAARFRRLQDLYQDHKDGKPIGFGPAAERIEATFATITDTVKARGGDATVERGLLRAARISLRFGNLNHCAFDETNPVGALCLENTIVPPGNSGPLQDRCRPDRCHNSVVGPEHVPIWESEKRTLLTLIDTPKLPGCRKQALQRELSAVDAVLGMAQNKEQW